METKNRSQLPSDDANKKSGNKLISGHRYSISETTNGFELTAHDIQDSKTKLKLSENILLALLPSNVQGEFKAQLLNRFPNLANNIHVGGISRAESITAHYFEKLESADQLPDILITSGFNIIYEDNFVSNFLNNKCFEYQRHSLNPMFQEAGMAHPKNLVSLVGAEPLVMVADRRYFERMSVPREWYELLNPRLANSIVFPHGEDYYREAVYYPFIQNYGPDAIHRLKQNTKETRHPSEMLTSMVSGDTADAAIYIMPCSYALIAAKSNLNMNLIWPGDGAVAIPIQMLVKKGCYTKNAELIDFIMGKELGRIFVENGIVSANKNTNQNFHGHSLLWPGWDFCARSSSNKLIDKLMPLNY